MTLRPRWPSSLAVVLLTCGIALPRPAAAQSVGTLSGRVVDSRTGQPIPDVEVAVPSIGVRGLTDRDGFFVLLGIPAGGQDLVFDHLAYGRHTRQVSVEADDELVLEARLSQRAIQLVPLVVEALSDFGDRVLGEGVVVAKDTPNFIANRIGAFVTGNILRVMRLLNRVKRQS